MRILASRRGRLLAIPVLAVCAALILPPVGSATADPPGNNGTVKIDGIEFDSHPNNEPHVGCVFQVDFYGYDQGALNAKVSFTAIPPTGKFVPLITNDLVFIGEDAAGGGTDLDATKQYDLEPFLDEFMIHPQQGFHIKLKVNAPGSIGKDTKYKAFWVYGCGGYNPPTYP